MMISVKADINGDGEELDYEEASPNGLCYRETVGFCRSLSTVLRHRFFDWSIGVIVVLNTLIIIVEADINAQIPSGGKATKSLLLCETLNAVLGYFYVVELLLKIMVLGGATYWMRLQHRFDALTAALVVAGQIIMRAAVSQLVPICDVIQYILLLRLTRTLRLVVLVRRFNEIFGTFVDLIPAFSTLFGMMWTVFSVFASIGMVLFGGRVRYSSIALNGTDYAESDYFANNFNDFTSSLVTLFELLVVNNWQVLMDGFVRVTSPYHRWFFILFWSIAVVVILNLVVAFILEAFFTKDEQRRNQDEVGSPEGSAAANESNDVYGSVGSPKTRIRRAASALNLHEGFY
jgi:two pore calcium channel protein